MILVDWGNGAGFPYSQATANTRVVGAEIAVFVSSLNHVLGTSNAKYHLIGHSLGAHIAGYAGSRLPGLRRITGKRQRYSLEIQLYLQCIVRFEQKVRLFSFLHTVECLNIRLMLNLTALFSQALILLSLIIRILISKFAWIKMTPTLWMQFIQMDLIMTQYQVTSLSLSSQNI